MIPRKTLCLSFCLVFAQACSGSSGGGSNEVNELDASNVGNANATFNAIEGLLFDEGVSETRLESRSQDTTTMSQFSFMGCHYLQDRQRMIDEINSIRVPLCYMSAIEEYLSAFSIPEGEYAYYRITGETEGAGGPPTEEGAFLLRVGKFTVDGRNALRYQACEGGAQSEDFLIVEGDNGVRAKSSYEFTHSNPDTGEEFAGRGSVDLVATGETTDKIEELEVNSAFIDSWGEGSTTLLANRAERKNTFIGRFSDEWTSMEGTYSSDFGVCVVAGDGKGSGHTEGTWESPPYYVDSDEQWYCPTYVDDPSSQAPLAPDGENTVCEIPFEDDESFQLGALDPFVIPESESPWAADLVSCEIPTSPSGVVAFTTEWDCVAPDSFIELDMSAIPLEVIQECVDIEESRNQDFVSCEEKFNDEVTDDGSTL